MSDSMKHSVSYQRNNLKGFLFALSGTILVSTNFVTAKYALMGFNPQTFSMVWTIAATCYAFIVILISGQIKNLAIPKNVIKNIVVLGLATGIGMLLGWAGLALLDPSFASFLWRFAPVLTIMLSVFFLGERMGNKEIIPVVVMIMGGALSTIGRWHIVGLGVILTILACCAVSVQMVTAKMKVHEIHPNVLVFYRVGIAALFIVCWTFLTGKAQFNVRFPFWGATLLGAFLGPCASFLLTFRSYKYWELSRSSIVLTSQPLIVLPMAYLAFGKIPSGMQLIGGLVILIGAFWLMFIHKNRKLR
jgi:drug/metabolite transporter (DMT)-like permease